MSYAGSNKDTNVELKIVFVALHALQKTDGCTCSIVENIELVIARDC